MLQVAYVLAVASGLSLYPAFGDRGSPPVDARLEAAIDKGPIYELIVNCGNGAAIMSYSKVERVFCTPYDGCMPSSRRAIAMACGR
ncbi:MAG: hypothetical protein K0U34_06590 [Alphaproteobacteria bacterium]|nr:hypothetical protein [Alphaproteobacteria bacterium]